jgi:hypothetical protein
MEGSEGGAGTNASDARLSVPKHSEAGAAQVSSFRLKGRGEEAMKALLAAAVGLTIPAAVVLGGVAPEKQTEPTPLVIEQDVVINGSLTVNLTDEDQIVTIHAYRDGQLLGTLQYGHPDRRNELGLIGFRDPPKVRLASDLDGTSSFGALSFNKWDGETMREAGMLIGDPAEDQPDEAGGQIRAIVADNGGYEDEDQRVVAVWSPKQED